MCWNSKRLLCFQGYDLLSYFIKVKTTWNQQKPSETSWNQLKPAGKPAETTWNQPKQAVLTSKQSNLIVSFSTFLGMSSFCSFTKKHTLFLGRHYDFEWNNFIRLFKSSELWLYIAIDALFDRRVDRFQSTSKRDNLLLEQRINSELNSDCFLQQVTVN